MSAPAEHHASDRPSVGYVLGIILAVLLGGYAFGEAIFTILSRLSAGLNVFAVNVGNAASASDSIFRFMLKLSLGLASFAIVAIAFKMVSLYKAAGEHHAHAAAHPAPAAHGG